MAEDTPRERLRWDTHTAGAVIVMAALAFLLLVRAGFRPVITTP